MLSTYAQGHLRMAEIGKRFDKVMARHPAREKLATAWRIKHARIEGTYQFSSFALACEVFDHELRSR